MKNIKYFLMIVFICRGLIIAQNVSLTSQVEVNTFGSSNPTTITGFLVIRESTAGDITDLTPLSTITSIGGNFYLGLNSSLNNLNGLHNITSVGGYLKVESNTLLNSFDGLTNLNAIVGYLMVRYNSSLTNLDGLQNLFSVGDNLNISSNSVLNSFCGIHPLLNGDGLNGSYFVSNNGTNPTQQEIIDSGPCTPLPVELTTFAATINESEVKLLWSTATEVNNYGFYVERRTEIEDWEKIAFVEGHGNSNSPKHYEFLDNINRSGKYLYRLKQIDIDGSFDYSKTVEVDLGLPTEFELSQNYPNPFNPTTKIQYSIPVGDENVHQVQLKVYDVLGSGVATLVNEKQEAGSYKVNFNASNLTSGIYFYTLTSGNFVQTKKMILLR